MDTVQLLKLIEFVHWQKKPFFFLLKELKTLWRVRLYFSKIIAIHARLYEELWRFISEDEMAINYFPMYF